MKLEKELNATMPVPELKKKKYYVVSKVKQMIDKKDPDIYNNAREMALAREQLRRKKGKKGNLSK